MFKYKDRVISPGASWTDDNNITHPANWHIWSAEDKKSHGVTEVVEETPPDSRLYNWSQNSDGTINKSAKALDDTGSGDNLVRGVRWHLKETVNKQQNAILSQTDWYVIRKADKGTAIPDAVQAHRDSIRSKGDAMKASIDDASDTNAVAILLPQLFNWYDK